MLTEQVLAHPKVGMPHAEELFMKPTETDKLMLSHLLYLVTHSEAANAAVLAEYRAARIGNPGLPDPKTFAAALETLYVRSCR